MGVGHVVGVAGGDGFPRVAGGVSCLRRFLGHDVQYFATVEPQRRLAPHIHIAIRGTLSRTELRQVLAATYHQVWWPPVDQVKHDDANLPLWHEASGNYLEISAAELLAASA